MLEQYASCWRHGNGLDLFLGILNKLFSLLLPLLSSFSPLLHFIKISFVPFFVVLCCVYIYFHNLINLLNWKNKYNYAKRCSVWCKLRIRPGVTTQTACEKKEQEYENYELEKCTLKKKKLKSLQITRI